MADIEDARLQADHEALQFECELLRREARRLLEVNRTLEARLALAERESEGRRQYIAAMERSRPWRMAQVIRRWLGRRW
ncbi:MAG TPA: hypothetical protein VGR02_01490 [Thermoanaerobaculia bacterium]|jgi:hypothetical protein|nr:hypothetical protein [Thermoanaerobaculia bacterium]